MFGTVPAMSETVPKLEDECFFIAPIGSDGSDVRDRSDGVMNYIVTPAAAKLGLTTVRADTIAKPGEITRQVIEHVVGAKVAVVDLTGSNANVYYEMAVRHTAQLPTVLIAQQGEKLPFDISQMRTIFFDHTNLKSASQCGEQIVAHLKEALAGEVDSPISASVAVRSLETGSPQDKILAQLSDGMDDVLRGVGQILRQRSGWHPISPRAVHDLSEAFDFLSSPPDDCSSSDIDDARKRGLRALLHITRDGRPRFVDDQSVADMNELRSADGSIMRKAMDQMRADISEGEGSDVHKMSGAGAPE